MFAFMKIGLLSDTHSYLDPAIVNHFAECDELWHAGDIGDIQVCQSIEAIKPLVAVHGNIDSQNIRVTYPENQIIEREGLKIWITHIGGYPPRYTSALKQQLDDIKPDIFVCGHSHILKVISDPNRQLLHLNPGACGKHGFHQVRTLLRFDINAGKISNMEVIELGKRA